MERFAGNNFKSHWQPDIRGSVGVGPEELAHVGRPRRRAEQSLSTISG